ncbi:MAG: GIY-YIG nuclease family protein [Clostridium butyricum]|nr:GIY-YIG nuclease family protein [Clostridium butyricum]
MAINIYGTIYKVTNLVNGKVYIGQTTNKKGFDGRYCGSIKNTHNEHLKSAIEKYGINKFKVDKQIDLAFSKDELDAKERSWIAIYKSNNGNFGYNYRDGGSRGNTHEETKKKQSKARLDLDLAKHIICVNTLEEFSSGTLAFITYKGKPDNVANGITKYTQPYKSNIKYVYVWADDWNKMNDAEKQEKIDFCIKINKISKRKGPMLGAVRKGENAANYGKGKHIICVNTLEEFVSGTIAKKKYGSSPWNVANGKKDYVKPKGQNIKYVYCWSKDWEAMTEKEKQERIEYCKQINKKAS